MVACFTAAKEALASRGFSVRVAQNGNFLIVPQGGVDSEFVYESASIERIGLVALGIKLGWEWHIAEVESRRKPPTTSGESEN